MTDTQNTTTTVITTTAPPSTTTIITPAPSPLSRIAKVLIPILIIGMILVPPVAAVLAIAGAAHSHTNQGWVVPKPPISTPVTPTPPVVVTPAQTNYVQLGSYPTVDAAKKALQAFTKRNSSYYNILDLRVYKVTINGVLWYRIVFPTDTLDAANTTCAALKKGGQDCIVLTF